MAGRRDACASILVLTEDSAQEGHEVIEALCKRMLRQLEPSCQTHRIRFEPANDQARGAMRGNVWKSTSARDRQRRVDLIRTIATKLCEPNGFVMFHVDGDRVWSERSTAENPAKFAEVIEKAVRALLAAGHNRKEPMPEAEAAKRLKRLRLLVPHYSIEAWLYQHVDAAIRLCHQHYNGHSVERFEEWRKDHGALDEVGKPKEAVCLGARHNAELAGSGYPADDVYKAGKSWAAAVDSLLDCDELCAALRETYQQKQSDSDNAT